MGKRWTQKDIDTLTELYPNTSTQELCKLLDRKIYALYGQVFKMKLKKSPEYLKEHVHTIKPSVQHQFVKGHKVWNKGVKLGEGFGGKATQFPKGHKPHNWKPEGSIRTNVDGYKEIKVGKKYVLLHRHIYVAQVGEIQNHEVIRFKDGNKSNLDLNNLEKISREEHAIRNSVHNLPEDIKEVVKLKRTITKLITEHGKRQNSRS
jgi:Mor family transcriptional regulator